MFWPLQSSSEFSRVPEDSKFPLLGVWISSSHLTQSGVATWRVTYHWKTLDEGYNFVSDLFSIRRLQKNLWASKVLGVLISRISRLQLGSTGTKWHLVACPLARHKEYYKGEGGGFLKSRPWWILWICVCPWLIRALKVLQLCTNQLVVWFVQVRVNNWPACHSS